MPLYSILALAWINAIVVRGGRVLLALYALNLGAEPLTIGFLAATFSAFPTLLSWHAGRFADRFGSRWLLVLGGAGGGLGMLVPFLVRGLPAVFVAAAMIGLSFAIYNVSLQNLVGLLSTPANRTQNFSNYSLMMSLADFIGPMTVGFSIDHVGHATACLYLGLLSLVPVTVIAISGGGLPGGTRHLSEAGGGIRKMLAHAGVWKVLATSSLLQSGQDLFQFYIPVYAHSINLSASAIGVILAMNSASAFVVRMVLSRLIARIGQERVLMIAFTLGALSFMLVTFFTNSHILAAIAFMFGLGMGCGQPIVTMLMFSKSSEGRSGEALGLRMTVNHMTRVVGPVMFGAIATAFGLFAVFWANALMLGTGGALSRPAAKGPEITQ